MNVAGWPAERLKAKWGDGRRKLGVKSLKTWIWKSNFKTGEPRKLHTNRWNGEVSKEKAVCGMMGQRLPREPLTLSVQDQRVPFPTKSSPLPCTWLCSGSGWSFCYKNCFTPEPPCRHAVSPRRSWEQASFVEGEFEPCLSNVFICAHHEFLWKWVFHQHLLFVYSLFWSRFCSVPNSQTAS